MLVWFLRFSLTLNILNVDHCTASPINLLDSSQVFVQICYREKRKNGNYIIENVNEL